MNIRDYYGHDTQYYGIEEHRLVGGKGDGMRLLEVRNGRGLELTILPDRNLDIPRLSFGGINMNYFSPCGYVAPAYYDDIGSNWLRSFTAGFLTTCGLQSVGNPCEDEGEVLPLHGSIANTPAEQVYWIEEGRGAEAELVIRGVTKDEVIFGRKLRLSRQLRISLSENIFRIVDRIENTGDRTQPFEILYHMNMGYPLLTEKSIVTIPSGKVIPRNEHAADDIEHCLEMEKPTPGYEERCYYHVFDTEQGLARIWQPELNMGLAISFNAKELDGFVEWKMMGVRDYVLGLECGNCYPDGRDVMRRTGMLKFLEPGESKEYEVTVKLSTEKL